MRTLAQLLNNPVTIINRSDSGNEDVYGNQKQTETETETVGELQQNRRTEDEGHGEVSEADSLLILPAGTSIDTSDGVVVDGLEYEVVGQPWRARNLRLRTASHVEVTVRRVAGPEEGS